MSTRPYQGTNLTRAYTALGNQFAAPRRSNRPPVRELGQLPQIATLPGWATFFDELEQVPELLWPGSIRVYHAMRSDGQLSSLYHASVMPILRYRWFIDPNGSRPDVYEPIAEDLGLPILGNSDPSRPRYPNRFNFFEYAKHALLALVYGYMPFEIVGRYDDGGLWRLRKLAPRMPWTIGQIKVAPDGGLISILQDTAFGPNSAMRPAEIGVDRLVMHVYDKEGANWIGRSVFRDCYRSWLLKDRLLRIDAIRHERNGMGVPIIELPPNATKRQLAQAEALTQQYRAGLASGGAVPAGMKLTLKGVEGATSDVLSSIKYHDEAMSRKFLAMFVQLGVTKSGSRALSESFIDFFSLAQENYADNFVRTTNEHVIEDWVDWNFGEDEKQVPLLTYEKNDDPVLAAQDLSTLIADGIIQMDDELEEYIRDKYRLPPRGTGPVRQLVPRPAGAPPGKPAPAPANLPTGSGVSGGN